MSRTWTACRLASAAFRRRGSSDPRKSAPKGTDLRAGERPLALGGQRAEGDQAGLDVDVQEVHVDRLLADAPACQLVDDGLIGAERPVAAAEVLVAAERPRYLLHGADVIVIGEDAAELHFPARGGLLAEVGQDLLPPLDDSSQSARHPCNADDGVLCYQLAVPLLVAVTERLHRLLDDLDVLLRPHGWLLLVVTWGVPFGCTPH